MFASTRPLFRCSAKSTLLTNSFLLLTVHDYARCSYCSCVIQKRVRDSYQLGIFNGCFFYYQFGEVLCLFVLVWDQYMLILLDRVCITLRTCNMCRKTHADMHTNTYELTTVHGPDILMFGCCCCCTEAPIHLFLSNLSPLYKIYSLIAISFLLLHTVCSCQLSAHSRQFMLDVCCRWSLAQCILLIYHSPGLAVPHSPSFSN